MSDFFRRGARHGNSKSDAISGGMVVGMTVYPSDDRCSKLVGLNIVKISEADYRDHPDLCMKIVVEALLSLPSGFYTLVNHTEPVPCVMDIRLADKGCGLRLRPFERETINRIKQPAYLPRRKLFIRRHILVRIEQRRAFARWNQSLTT